MKIFESMKKRFYKKFLLCFFAMVLRNLRVESSTSITKFYLKNMKTNDRIS